jgi:hypothetical protein
VSEGWTADLIVLAFCAGISSALIAARDLPMTLSLALAAIRVGIPLVYFAAYFDGAWTVLDDLSYVAQGSELLRCGYNPWTVLIYPHGWDYLRALSEGHHVLYTWWNLLAMTLFGEHYYSAVFFNVLATFFGASLLVRTLRLLGFGPGYCVGFQIFWLLHWDVVAWTSLLNIKDVLVQTLTIAALYCLVSYIVERKARFLVAFLGVAQLFWWIRFYVPVILLVAVMLWMITQWSDLRKYILIPLGLLAFYFAVPLITSVTDYWEFKDFVYGAVRFSLTPMPWNIEEIYAYLWLPTVLHWLFFIPALIGAACLWSESKHTRLFLIYWLCLIGLYAVTEQLLGPRQRFQVAFVFAWAQFHFLWKLRPLTAAGTSPAAPSRSTFPSWPALAENAPAVP